MRENRRRREKQYSAHSSVTIQYTEGDARPPNMLFGSRGLRVRSQLENRPKRRDGAHSESRVEAPAMIGVISNRDGTAILQRQIGHAHPNLYLKSQPCAGGKLSLLV